MNQLRACLAVSGAFLLAALFGTAPPVHAQQDAWRATPPPGKTLMFVFRSERETVAARVPVFVNSVRLGELANGSFVIATVNPGRLLLRVGEQTAPTYAFEAAANQSYFARVAALAGVQPVRTEVRLVREAEARPVLAQGRFLGAPTVAVGAPQSEATAAVTSKGAGGDWLIRAWREWNSASGRSVCTCSTSNSTPRPARTTRK